MKANPKLLAPVTTVVRVTRKQTLEVVEYVDVTLCRRPAEKGIIGDEEVAKDLIVAKEAAGEDVNRFTVSEAPGEYSHPRYSTEMLATEGRVQEPEPPAPPAPPPSKND